MLSRDQINQIIDLYEENRPRWYIATEVRADLDDVKALLRLLGANNSSPELGPEKYGLIETAVNEGWSLSEIRRSYGTEPSTVRRWFPHYKTWPVGESPESGAIRKGSRILASLR